MIRSADLIRRSERIPRDDPTRRVTGSRNNPTRRQSGHGLRPVSPAGGGRGLGSPGVHHRAHRARHWSLSMVSPLAQAYSRHGLGPLSMLSPLGPPYGRFQCLHHWDSRMVALNVFTTGTAIKWPCAGGACARTRLSSHLCSDHRSSSSGCALQYSIQVFSRSLINYYYFLALLYSSCARRGLHDTCDPYHCMAHIWSLIWSLIWLIWLERLIRPI